VQETSVVEAPGMTLELVETPFTEHKNNAGPNIPTPVAERPSLLDTEELLCSSLLIAVSLHIVHKISTFLSFTVHKKV
jgi:hypothetical protein